jgi:hypothetical protein
LLGGQLILDMSPPLTPTSCLDYKLNPWCLIQPIDAQYPTFFPLSVSGFPHFPKLTFTASYFLRTLLSPVSTGHSAKLTCINL